MEDTKNMAITARRFMNTLRTILFVLRKGLSKAKITCRDLNMLKKRGKMPRKLVQTLLSLHHNHIHDPIQTPPRVEFVNKRNYKQSASSRFFSTCVHAPETFELDVVDTITVENAIELGLSGDESPDFFWSPMVLNDSPMLPGFGRTPAVKQLRITDSPYPIMDVGCHDNHVDEAAEKFIARFYKALRKQS